MPKTTGMNAKTKPVVLIIFNRPDLIPAVLAPVRAYAPPRIYVVADGPRESRPAELGLCKAARQTALAAIDWPTEVIQVFSDTNLGCRRRVVSGLDYVFERESEAIILEDDTVPGADFLDYCERMLEAHRNDRRIFSITGTRLFSRLGPTNQPFLSNFTHIWGWATWRRSWARYDRDLDSLASPIFADRLAKIVGPQHVAHWLSRLRRVASGEINTWDYQWQVSAWMAEAGCLTPPRNLIANLGFRADATHTAKPSIFAEMRTYRLRNTRTDWAGISPLYEWLFQNMFHNPGRLHRLVQRGLAPLVAREPERGLRPTAQPAAVQGPGAMSGAPSSH